MRDSINIWSVMSLWTNDRQTKEAQEVQDLPRNGSVLSTQPPPQVPTGCSATRRSQTCQNFCQSLIQEASQVGEVPLRFPVLLPGNLGSHRHLRLEPV